MKARQVGGPPSRGSASAQDQVSRRWRPSFWDRVRKQVHLGGGHTCIGGAQEAGGVSRALWWMSSWLRPSSAAATVYIGVNQGPQQPFAWGAARAQHHAGSRHLTTPSGRLREDRGRFCGVLATL